MIYPSVHSNGTGKAGLRKQYDEAILRLRDAMNALRDAQPHGRDYYTQGDEAFSQARKEYLEREAKLRSVFDDLVHLRHVLEGVGEKRA